MNKTFLFFLFPFIIFGQSELDTAKQFLKEKQYSKVETLLNSYVKTHPKNLEAIELLGDAFGYQKKWDNAIEQYQTLVNNDPTVANFQYKYGGSLGMKALSISKFRALGLIGNIKRAFIKAADLDPNHIDTRWALVELYMQLPGIFGGSKKKSFKYANELEALSKVDGYLAKGYIYEYDDEPELAEKYYKKAIDVGGSLTCFEKLTNFYKNENQPANAIKNIEEAQQKHQRNALHYQIGKVCADYNLQLEKGEKCLNIYMANHSAKDGVPIEWAYYRMAQIQKHKGNKIEALKWIDKALMVRSNFKYAIKEKEAILKL